MRRLVVAVCVCLPSLASAWPQDADWAPLRRGGASLVDHSNDASSWLDLWGSSRAAVGQWSADDTTLHLRMRLAGDPSDGAGMRAGQWAWLIDTDGDQIAETAVGLIGEEASVWSNPALTADLDGVGWTSGFPIGSLADDRVRVVALSDGSFGLDVAVDRADLLAELGLASDTSFRVTVVTGTDLAAATTDRAHCTTLGGWCTTFGDIESDAITLDADGDGLTGSWEQNAGSSDQETDTDEDGIEDQDDPNPASCDTDRDGILDGVEVGLTDPAPDTDLGRGCFVADTDPGTVTDPAASDSDGGGIGDGVEDWNYNGRMDAGEGDPADPSDDLDSDGDGVPDIIEGTDDLDGDGDPNHLDPDLDGDELPDSSEGMRDLDGDGLPNLFDDDSDNDGLLDGEDGLSDPDGDGLAAYEDADADNDGLPDGVEGTSDPDRDGLPAHLDLDSDGDGRLDSDDGTGDEDCDGLVNFLDKDHEDGFCDSGQPDPSIDTDVVVELNDLPTLSGGGSYGGGACNTDPAGVTRGVPGWVVVGVTAFIVLFRRFRFSVLLVMLASPIASAGEVSVQRFRASVDGHRFMKLDAVDEVVPWRWGAGLVFDVADDPFVFRPDPASGADEIPIVGSVSTLRITTHHQMGRWVRLGFSLPVHLLVKGLDVVRAPAMGDLRASSKLSVLTPTPDLPLGLGGYVDLTMPTGWRGSWVSNRYAQLRGGAIVGVSAGPLHLTSNVGARTGSGVIIGDLVHTAAVEYGLGVALESRWVGVALEGDGEVWLGNPGKMGALPAEWLLTGQVHLPGDLLFRAGAGSGLTSGMGAPDLRVVASMVWMQGSIHPKPAEDTP